jgi:hypothetical protein
MNGGPTCSRTWGRTYHHPKSLGGCCEAVLLNPNFAPAVVSVRESETAARAIGIKLVIFSASSDAEIEAAFAKIVQARSGALLVAPIHCGTTRMRVGVSTAALHARGSLEGSFSPTETTFGLC